MRFAPLGAAGVVAALLVLVVVYSAGQNAGPTAASTTSPTPTSGPGPIADSYVLVKLLPEVNFSRMISFALIPGLPDQAVMITQDGFLWRFSLSSAFQPYLFGDLRDRVLVASPGGEEGLLGIAFSPTFQTDSRVYIYYNRKLAVSPAPACPWNPNPLVKLYTYDTLSRFLVSGNVLVPASEETLIALDDCDSWHNGGQLYFGTDGYLYLSIGDGGNSGDPYNHGQRTDVLFGKIIRLDVSGATGYTSPPDNPFVGVAGRDEIWAYGLRNPWRFSFDPATGDMWLGDVGGGFWEEVNKVARGGNYGWVVMEGYICAYVWPPDACDESPFVLPREVYSNYQQPQCAIQGGFVYRGSVFPEVFGWYTYADYCTGEVWALDTTGPDTCPPAATGCHGIRLVDSPYSIVGFGRLPNGELVVITSNNAIYRLAPNDSDDDDDGMPDATDPCPVAADCDADSLRLSGTQTGGSCPTASALPRFRDCIETFVGTNPQDGCADTSTANDEVTDKVPADFNDDQRINVTDRTLMALKIKAAAVDARFDLNASGGAVNVSDRTILVFYVKATAGAFCTP